MKRLHFLKPNNLSQLHHQLLAAIPALRPVSNTAGRRGRLGQLELEPVMGVEGLRDDIWLTVPDDADETAIASVVQSHDPAAAILPSPAEQRDQRISELLAIPRSDWTVAQQRELLQLIAQQTLPSP